MTDTINYSNIPQTRTEDGAFVFGDPDAPVTIVAFEDFLCPHCKAYQDTLHEFIEQHVIPGEARFEYRDLPVHGEDSYFAYGLVICATTKHIHFLRASDTMFRLTGDEALSKEEAHTFADELGLNDIQLTTCASENDQFRIDASIASANDIQKTPTIVVRDENGDIQTDALPRQPDLETLTAFIEERTGHSE
jgi:protein-disulfide isomerase